MKWELPRENYYNKKPEYPVFPMLLIVLLVFCVTALLTLPGWPEGKGFNKEFFLSVTYPAALWSVGLMAIVTFIARLFRFDYYAVEYLSRKGIHNFQNWAIDSLPLTDCSMLLPVEYLSLKMQGIEGEAPISPATPLKIEIQEQSMTASRLNQVLVKLLEPLGKQIGRPGNFFSIWIYAKNGDESLSDEVRNALISIKAPVASLKSINVMTEPPGYDLINTWIDEDFACQRLLINIELHSPEEATFFENATAFLFDNSPRKEDSPVYLLRMMDTLKNKIRETSKIFLSANQLDPSTLKQVFTCNLNKKEKENLYTALNENHTGIEQDKRYELERVTGVATEAQKWVTLALAAEAVQYGQGNQLVAGSADDKIYVGMLAEKYPGWWPEPWQFPALMYGFFSTLIILLPALILIPVIFVKWGGKDSFHLFLMEVAAALIIVLVPGAFIHSTIINNAQSDMGIYHAGWNYWY